MRNPFKLPFLSAVLLAVSFPRINFFWLAWLAWVPLFLELRNTRSLMTSFWLSYLTGFLFLLFSIHWLREVTLFGLAFVCAYQALYFALFGLAAKWIMRRFEGIFFENRAHPIASEAFLLAGIPAVFVALEWIRAEIPVMGFGWNQLAYSQADNLLVIQLAKLIGAYGLSYLMMLINVVIFILLAAHAVRPRVLAGIFGLSLFLLNVYFGAMEVQKNYAGPLVNVAVIQGNIEQEKKWVPGLKELIIEKYVKLTELAAFDGPDLIVWPEAAYPGFFNEEYQGSAVVEAVKKSGIPLLVGSPHQENAEHYYNSAYLLSKSGEITGRYDKIHLVPFGEYVPFKPVLSFLGPYAYALGVSDFSAGRDYTVFEMPFGTMDRIRFSTLICFEDLFPGLALNFVQRGAECLMVITNDAWFGKSGAPYQHQQASIFRAVENGVPVVRAGNIGVSSFISPRGEVVDEVRNERGFETYVTGALTRPVAFVHLPTFYQAWGHYFPQLCLVLTGLTLFGCLAGKRKPPAEA